MSSCFGFECLSSGHVLSAGVMLMYDGSGSYVNDMILSLPEGSESTHATASALRRAVELGAVVVKVLPNTSHFTHSEDFPAPRRLPGTIFVQKVEQPPSNLTHLLPPHPSPPLILIVAVPFHNSPPHSFLDGGPECKFSVRL